MAWQQVLPAWCACQSGPERAWRTPKGQTRCGTCLQMCLHEHQKLSDTEVQVDTIAKSRNLKVTVMSHLSSMMSQVITNVVRRCMPSHKQALCNYCKNRGRAVAYALVTAAYPTMFLHTVSSIGHGDNRRPHIKQVYCIYLCLHAGGLICNIHVSNHASRCVCQQQKHGSLGCSMWGK